MNIVAVAACIRDRIRISLKKAHSGCGRYGSHHPCGNTGNNRVQRMN